MPDSTLISAVCRQVATGSPQPSMLKVQSPTASGVSSAAHRSSATGHIRTRWRSLPCGSRSTAVAATASWPSRNTVAVTSNVSPTTALAG